MSEELKVETPLGELLPVRVKAVLQKNGVHTVEGVRRAYPHQLLKMWGMGMLRFRTIEALFFPGETFIPKRIFSPVRNVKGSTLNGILSPATVQALARGGIKSIEELLATAPEDLLKIRGFGIEKLREIEGVFYPSRRNDLPRSLSWG